MASASAASAAAPPARRVSFGTMPDFAFEGPGVKVGGVVPGSPAEKAGLKTGDVVLKLDGKEVANLRDFSEKLKGMNPGQEVTVTLSRDGMETVVPVVLVER